jgi:hypothetical protein
MIKNKIYGLSDSLYENDPVGRASVPANSGGQGRPPHRQLLLFILCCDLRIMMVCKEIRLRRYA